MSESSWREWLMANRTSVRLAFILRIISMAVSTALSLVWTPLLLRSMGKELFGFFSSFQAVPRLGGLGDLGISSSVAIRAGQMVGRREFDELRIFLMSARAMVVVVAPALMLLFFALSPVLPRWLGFDPLPGSGSVVLLFQTAAPFLFFMIVGGYFHSLNTAYGTTTWQILPALIVAQGSVLAHWLLARWGYPLWVQHLPYVAAAAAHTVTGWLMLKLSHPWLAELRPVRFNWGACKEILQTGGWGYFYAMSNLIYTMTDRLIIQAGFGAAMVPMYVLNLKFCELAIALILSSTAASLPKITHWVSSPEPDIQQRARLELRRLNVFHILLGCGAALTYLIVNDAFIRVWVGAEYVCNPYWLWAFALNLAVTVSGDVGVQVAGICGREGLRKAAIVIGGTGLLNLVLSLAAMKAGSIFGIAAATVLAQSLAAILLSGQVCRYLKLPLLPWLGRSWLVPVSCISVAFWLRQLFPPNDWTNASILAGAYLLIVIVIARLAGLDASMLKHEWHSVKKTLAGRR